MSGTVGKNAGRASGIVGAGDIGADAVDSANIADDAIDSEHYADGSIDNAHIADDAIDSEHYAAGSIDTAHIADNQITLAKMAGGTDGNIISFDASGDPVAIATGSDGEVLTSTGAGSPPAFEAAAGGGAWTLIGTQVASNSANLTQTGLNSTYDTYAIALSDIVPSTDPAAGYLRLGDSGGIDSGASDYNSHYNNSTEGGDSYNSYGRQGESQIIETPNIGGLSGEGFGGLYYLSRPGDGTMKPIIHGTGVLISDEMRLVFGGGMHESVITLDRVQFLFSTGNVASGRMTIWGIAHA